MRRERRCTVIISCMAHACFFLCKAFPFLACLSCSSRCRISLSPVFLCQIFLTIKSLVSVYGKSCICACQSCVIIRLGFRGVRSVGLYCLMSSGGHESKTHLRVFMVSTRRRKMRLYNVTSKFEKVPTRAIGWRGTIFIPSACHQENCRPWLAPISAPTKASGSISTATHNTSKTTFTMPSRCATPIRDVF